MKILKWLDMHFEETLLVILLIIISCVSMLQVVVRKVPWIPSFTWAEEFCRFCWIWSVFISLPYTIRISSMLRVTVLADLMPNKIRNCFNIAVDLITAACMALFACYSVPVLQDIIASGEASPAMLWPMWVVYSFMLIGFVLAFLRSLQMAYLHVKHFHEKELTTLEEAMSLAAEEAKLAKEGGDA